MRLMAVAVSLVAAPAVATTITWSGLSSGVLTGTYDEGGYRFSWTTGSYSQLLNGVRVVENNPIYTGGAYPATNFMVTRIGGGLFSFDSVAVANLNGVVTTGNHGPARNSAIIVQGFLGGTALYGPILDANRNALATVSSGVAGTMVDSLTFILGGGVFPTDIEAVTNIVLTEAVPEPAMLGLFGLGAVGLLATRRRKAT